MSLYNKLVNIDWVDLTTTGLADIELDSNPHALLLDHMATEVWNAANQLMTDGTNEGDGIECRAFLDPAEVMRVSFFVLDQASRYHALADSGLA